MLVDGPAVDGPVVAQPADGPPVETPVVAIDVTVGPVAPPVVAVDRSYYQYFTGIDPAHIDGDCIYEHPRLAIGEDREKLRECGAPKKPAWRHGPSTVGQTCLREGHQESAHGRKSGSYTIETRGHRSSNFIALHCLHEKRRLNAQVFYRAKSRCSSCSMCTYRKPSQGSHGCSTCNKEAARMQHAEEHFREAIMYVVAPLLFGPEKLQRPGN